MEAARGNACQILVFTKVAQSFAVQNRLNLGELRVMSRLLAREMGLFHSITWLYGQLLRRDCSNLPPDLCP